MYFRARKSSQIKKQQHFISELIVVGSGRKSNRLDFNSGGHLPGFEVKDDRDDDGGAGGVDNDDGD